MYKQTIIARRDLSMSAGKISAQVSHASMSFLSWFIRNNVDENGHVDGYIDTGILNNWLNDSFTKVVLGAKNKNQLLKAKTMAEERARRSGRKTRRAKPHACTRRKRKAARLAISLTPSKAWWIEGILTAILRCLCG